MRRINAWLDVRRWGREKGGKESYVLEGAGWRVTGQARRKGFAKCEYVGRTGARERREGGR